MKIIFKFNKEKDLFNIWETCKEKPWYGYDFRKRVPKEVLKICKDKSFKKCKKILEDKHEEIHKRPEIKLKEKEINGAWRKIEKSYFQRLEKVTKRKFPFKKIYGYLTIAPRCPYRPHWRPPAFYIPVFADIQKSILIASHELMHIHLHNINWWKKVEKELGNKRTHDLKEALTVLLNLEFRDLWNIADQGYPNHKKLREYIGRQWKKEKNFEKLTNKCIKWIKKNGIK